MGGETVERKYALRRIKAGDYIFFSNDRLTLWRVYRYEDGPSHGLDGWPRDRMFWGLRKWETPIVLGETSIELENWDRWDEVSLGYHSTRQQAINAALATSPSQSTDQKEATNEH